MKVGKFYSMFPTFEIFCDRAREVPHALPHKFAGAIEGYYQFIGKRPFILDRYVEKPSLPMYQDIWTLGKLIEKLVYPIFKKAVLVMDREVRNKIPEETRKIYEPILEAKIKEFTAGDVTLVYNYVSVAADKILRFLTPDPIPDLPRIPLAAVPPYIEMSEGAAKYFAESTYYDLSAVPKVVNDIKKENLTIVDLPYPRLPRYHETIVLKEKKTAAAKKV